MIPSTASQSPSACFSRDFDGSGSRWKEDCLDFRRRSGSLISIPTNFRSGRILRLSFSTTRSRLRPTGALFFIALHRTNFLITTSVDGHLKFWKKQAEGIEFVKHYRTHLSPIVHVAVDEEGKSLASLGEDVGGKTTGGEEVKGSVKVFEVENFGEYFAGDMPSQAYPGRLSGVLTCSFRGMTDMINIIKLPFSPRVCCWIHGRGDGRVRLAV